MPIHWFFIVAWFISVGALGASADTHRVVSLSPSITQSVADLKLGHTLVGITKFCQRPNNATKVQIIGTLTSPSIETIIELNPTVVFADREANRRQVADKLQNLGLHLVAVGPHRNYEDIQQSLLTIAQALGADDRAKQLIQNAQKRLDRVAEPIKAAALKSVFIEIWPKPLKTVSRHGFVHSVFARAGAKNVFADSSIAYPNISMEAVIAKRPEVIAVLTHSVVDDTRVQQYESLSAFDQAQVLLFNSSKITQPSLMNFVEAVETVAQRLYPQLNLQPKAAP